MNFQFWILVIIALLVIGSFLVSAILWAKAILAVSNAASKFFERKQTLEVPPTSTKDTSDDASLQKIKPFDTLLTAIAGMIARKDYKNIGVITEGVNTFIFKDMDTDTVLLKASLTEDLLAKSADDVAKELTEGIPRKGE